MAALAAHLTARDRWLLRMIHEHQVLTTSQITALAFGTPRAANARLATLHRMRAVDRFRPLRQVGSAPWHYVLDEAGAAVLAVEYDLPLAALGYRRDRATAIAHSLTLAHTVGANAVFTALAAHARRNPGACLAEWWSERRCAQVWGDVARPDAYGTWREHSPTGIREVDFFLEYDTGTEQLDRLVGKLPGYAELAAATAITTPVLFHLHSPRREEALHRHLLRAAPTSPAEVPVATTARPMAAYPGQPVELPDPADAVWLPAGHHTRLRLIDLARPASDSPTAARALPAPPPAPDGPHDGPVGEVEAGADGMPWPAPDPTAPPPLLRPNPAHVRR